MAEGVAYGLSHMHQQGFVHCDLKTENILMVDGTAKISDFGISLGECATMYG